MLWASASRAAVWLRTPAAQTKITPSRLRAASSGPQLVEGNVPRTREVPVLPFAVFPHVDDVHISAGHQLLCLLGRHRSDHASIITNGWPRARCGSDHSFVSTGAAGRSSRLEPEEGCLGASMSSRVL